MILNSTAVNDKTEEKVLLEEKSKSLINLALCYNKIGKYEQACLACQDVLAIDHKNVKAYYQ